MCCCMGGPHAGLGGRAHPKGGAAPSNRVWGGHSPAAWGNQGERAKKKTKTHKNTKYPPLKREITPPLPPPKKKKNKIKGKTKEIRANCPPPGCKEPFGWTPTVLLCAPPAAQPPQPCLPPSAALCRPSAAATPTGPGGRGERHCRDPNPGGGSSWCVCGGGLTSSESSWYPPL